jgi:hypothetical protein
MPAKIHSDDTHHGMKPPALLSRRRMREQIRTVMRYAGPRVIYAHPWLAVMHVIDGLRLNGVCRKRSR